MDHFEYRDATLYAEDVKISDIAAQVGTPFYCYSSATLRHHYHILADAMAQAGLPDTLICFSVKANSNIAVIGTLAQLGAAKRLRSAWPRRALQVLRAARAVCRRCRCTPMRRSTR